MVNIHSMMKLLVVLFSYIINKNVEKKADIILLKFLITFKTERVFNDINRDCS